MNPKTKYLILVLAAVLLLSPLALQAQGELSLESLLERLNRTDERVAAIETAIAPTPNLTATARATRATARAVSRVTATARARSRPTATPRPTAIGNPTATPRPACNLPGIPEPPPPAQRLNCEAWGVTYKLVSIAADGASIDGMLPRVLREFYPLVVKSARNCRVSPNTLGDLVYMGAREMERMGKPSQGNAIGYLLGVMADKVFTDLLKEAGGCTEAIVLVIYAAE